MDAVLGLRVSLLESVSRRSTIEGARATLQRNQFKPPDSRRIQDLEHRAVADSRRCSQINHVQQSLACPAGLPWDVMVEFLQQLRAGQVDRSQWSVDRFSESSNHDSENRATPMLQDAMSGTNDFDKLMYQAIYWYLIDQIAERLKSGELRNATIYEFNPDVLYNEAPRTKNLYSLASHRHKNKNTLQNAATRAPKSIPNLAATKNASRTNNLTPFFTSSSG